MSPTSQEPRCYEAPVYSAYVCRDNSELVAHVMRLYAPVTEPGAPKLTIADVTYGKGVFWRGIDLSQYELRASDLLTVPDHPYDFRDLPYEDESLDIVVLDPPYAHHGLPRLNDNYRGMETTRLLDHDGIIDLYRGGLAEAARVVRPGGSIWIKCQDEIESGKQKWSHVEILHAAESLGLCATDLFVLLQSKSPIIQHRVQQHARKNHSYLWILRRASRRTSPGRIAEQTAASEIQPLSQRAVGRRFEIVIRKDGCAGVAVMSEGHRWWLVEPTAAPPADVFAEARRRAA